MPVAEIFRVSNVLTHRPPELKITKYDVTISVLAVAASIAVLTLMLMVILFASSTVPITLTDPAPYSLQGSGPDAAQEFAQIETPSVESPEEIAFDPSLANDERDVTELTEVIEHVADESAIVAMVAGVPQSEGLTQASATSGVEGTGAHPLGHGDSKDRGVPKRERRWFVEFSEPGDLKSYAAQLDSLGIELAAMYPSQGRLVYLSKVSTDSPAKREIPERDAGREQRLFMSWADGSKDRRQADIELFQKVNIDASNAEVLHFYSTETEQQMAELEKDYSGRSELEIRRTHFRVRKSINGYEFYVAKQQLY